MKPEIELTWNPEKKRLFGQAIDSNNGIVTAWEVIPDMQVTIRTDQLPGNGLKRRIWDSEENDAPFSHTTTYSVEDYKDLTRRSISLYLNKADSTTTVYASFGHRRGGFDSFFVAYSGDGNVTSLSFNGNVQPGIWPERLAVIETKPFDECFDELVQIAKINGLSTFFGPIEKHMYRESETEPKLDFIAFIASLGIMTSTDHLPSDQLSLFFDIAGEYAEKQLLNRYGGDPFVMEHGESICFALALQIINQFNDHPNLQKPFSEQVEYFFDKTVKYLLAEYYEDIQRTGQFKVEYKMNDNDSMNVSLSSRGNKTHANQEIQLGEPFQFAEHSYALGRDEETGRLAVAIQNRLKSKEQMRFVFPGTVDITSMYTSIATPQNTGWENIFQLIPIAIDLPQK